MRTEFVGHGVYSFPEAARLVRLRAGRVGEWFRGRLNSKIGPVFTGDFSPVGEDRVISFLDLVDVFVAGQLREHGVSLQTLRRVYVELQGVLETRHAFCRRELLTDGGRIFIRGLDQKGREEIIDVLDKQRVFPQIILPFLKSIDYAPESNLARRWHIGKKVVIDPQIAFGQPTIEAVGVSTAILAAAFHANDRDEALVADWYNVHSEDVIAAARFEAGLAA